eukprot:6462140-Amphidinium_carterae.2
MHPPPPPPGVRPVCFGRADLGGCVSHFACWVCGLGGARAASLLSSRVIAPCRACGPCSTSPGVPPVSACRCAFVCSRCVTGAGESPKKKNNCHFTNAQTRRIVRGRLVKM